MHMRSRARGI